MQSKKSRGRPPKSENQKATIRKRIIDSARTLFLEEGFEKVSMRKIAAEACLSPTALYHYFNNKRHLLHFLWQELFQQLSDSCQAGIKTYHEPVSRIGYILSQYMKYWIENPDHYRVIFMIEDLNAPPDEDLNAVELMKEVAVFKDLISTIEQGIEKKLFVIDDTELIWQTLMVHSQGVVCCLITIREIPWRSAGELIEQSIATTLKGLCA